MSFANLGFLFCCHFYRASQRLVSCCLLLQSSKMWWLICSVNSFLFIWSPVNLFQILIHSRKAYTCTINTHMTVMFEFNLISCSFEFLSWICARVIVCVVKFIKCREDGLGPVCYHEKSLFNWWAPHWEYFTLELHLLPRILTDAFYNCLKSFFSMVELRPPPSRPPIYRGAT